MRCRQPGAAKGSCDRPACRRPCRARRLQAHRGPVVAAAFSPHSARQLASIGADRRLMVWDLQAGALLHQSPLLSAAAPLAALSYDPSAPRLAVAAADGSVRFFDLSSLPSCRCLQVSWSGLSWPRGSIRSGARSSPGCHVRSRHVLLVRSSGGGPAQEAGQAGRRAAGCRRTGGGQQRGCRPQGHTAHWRPAAALSHGGAGSRWCHCVRWPGLIAHSALLVPRVLGGRPCICKRIG